MWGRGPAPRDPHRLLWLSGRIRSRLSAGRPVSGQVPGNGERARWVAARLRVQGCSSEARAQRAHPLACVRLRSPAPVPSPEGAGLQQPGKGTTQTIHSPAAVPGPRASRKLQARSHGARVRGNAADTGWQCHREPTGTAPRLTVAAPR